MLQRHSTAFQALALFLLAIIAYANTLNHGYNLDDFLLKNNLPEAGLTWEGLREIFTSSYNNVDYRPISVLSFAVEKHLFGEAGPEVSHRVNVLLFALTSLILFFCLRQLPVPHAGLLALLATALFIAHPIHANVVSSIKNRDNLLSLSLGLLALTSLLAAMKYRHRNRAVTALTKSTLVLASPALVLAATLAKLDAVGFIVILLLAFVVFSPRRIWLLYGALIGAVAVKAFIYIRYQVITPMLESEVFDTSVNVTENTMVQSGELLSKVSAALASVFYYLKFHLVPTGYYYYFGYDMIPVDQLWSWQNIVAAAALVASLFAFIWFFRRRPGLAFGIGFFYAALLYCLNVYTPVAGIVAPRLAFIASAGFCLVLADVLVAAAPRLGRLLRLRSMDTRRIALAATGLIVLIYLPFTWHRNSAWKDIFTLIDRDIPHLERSFEGQRIACMNYFDKSLWEGLEPDAVNEALRKSLAYCRQASAIWPDNQFVEETIGMALFRLGENAAALNQFHSVTARFDTTEIGYDHLGELHQRLNRPDSAAFYYRKLADVAVENELAYYKYTTAMVSLGRVDEAIAQYKDYVRRRPDLRYPYESLGYLYILKADTLTATQHFFYALDRGSPTMQYVNAMKPYYHNRGMAAEWLNLESGDRWEPDSLLSR